jgi:excisionase family DNA binding protein
MEVIAVNQDRQTLTAQEAAEQLNISHETVRKYFRRGIIEGVLSHPGRYSRLRLYKDSVDAYEERRKREGQQRSNVTDPLEG